MTPFTLLLSAISSIGAIGLALTLLRERPETNPNTDVLGERLQRFDKRFVDELAEAELAAPIAQRVLRPALEKLGRRLSRDSEASSRTHKALAAAGFPGGLTVGAFNAFVIITVISGAGVGYGLGLLLSGGDHQVLVLSVIVGLLVGFMGPRLWLSRKGKRRTQEIQWALPSICDLLTVSVEAGLGIDSATQRVCERYHNALGQELEMALRSIQLGVPRSEAFTAVGVRCGVDDVAAFIRAINQSQDMGTELGRVLRIFAEELRRRRRERAEQRGQQAALKMLFPMIGCIFPTLFVVLLGPAILSLTSH